MLCCAVCWLGSGGGVTRAQTAPGGMLEGRVMNPATGEYLEFVRVTVDGTHLETFTDITGAYRIVGLPAGEVTVRVFRTGAPAQTRRVMENLSAVLAAAGATFADVVKTTIFVLDLADFAAVNAVYAAHFSGPPPARSTVQVARLPRDARVEIEMIARIK